MLDSISSRADALVKYKIIEKAKQTTNQSKLSDINSSSCLHVLITWDMHVKIVITSVLCFIFHQSIS